MELDVPLEATTNEKMADEHVEGNSPRNTSEATPPHVDDSPEMVSQPSPPSDERVTSSSDCQPLEVADSPAEQNVSSSFEQDQSVSAGPSSLEAAGQISTNPAPETGSPLLTSLLSTPAFPPTPPFNPSTKKEDMIKLADYMGATFRDCFRKPIDKSGTKRNVDEKSADANEQFDVKDLSTASKRSSENVDLGSDSSPTGSGAPGEERRASGSSATEEAGLGSDSSPRIAISMDEKSSLEFGTSQNVSLEGELPSSKTGLAIPVSVAGVTMDVGLKSESSPSKSGPSSLEGSSSASVPTEKVSPKRKNPSREQHLPPKRSTPSSPGKLQKQSDSQMSTLLEELDIQETKGKLGGSEPISGHEQNIEREESNESETGETEQESNMEVEETDSQEAQDKTTEKYPKKDDTE